MFLLCFDPTIYIGTVPGRYRYFVNGNYIGTHVSVHYPFVYDIKGLLVEGTNTILVRVTTGLEEVTDKDLAELNYAVCTEYDNGGKYRSDKRRAFVRRPQYTVGWDWGPKVVSCGITGGARLEGHRQIALREVYVQTVEAAETAKLKIMLNIENLGFISSRTGAYKSGFPMMVKRFTKRSCSDVLLTSGYNYIEEEAVIENAQLSVAERIWQPAAVRCGSGSFLQWCDRALA